MYLTLYLSFPYFHIVYTNFILEKTDMSVKNFDAMLFLHFILSDVATDQLLSILTDTTKRPAGSGLSWLLRSVCLGRLNFDLIFQMATSEEHTTSSLKLAYR